MKKNTRVAIVHDWLYGGGAERVILELHNMFPEAPIYTSYCTDEWRGRLDNKVITGYLNKWPFTKLRKFLPLFRMWWFKSLNLSDYDLVISSTGNGEAKQVRARNGAKHICYIHTPVHFFWRHYDYYLKEPGFGLFNPAARLGLRVLVKPLRNADYKAAQKVDHFIANSIHIKNDVQKYYGREAVVVFPPIDIERFEKAHSSKRRGYVTMGRQVPYKRNDIIVEACTKLGVPLKVIGRGPDHDRLVSLSGPTIEFLTNVADEEMPAQLASAEAFIFAAFEDFGVAPIEALATGTPVIAYKAGGALDYVIAGKTGEFFDNQTVESVVEAIQRFDYKKYSADDIKSVAEQFSINNFRKNMQVALDRILQDT